MARNGLRLLATVILFFMVTVSLFTTCFGMWDYYESHNPKLTPEMEEYLWYRDAYYFLHSDDGGYFTYIDSSASIDRRPATVF